MTRGRVSKGEAGLAEVLFHMWSGQAVAGSGARVGHLIVCLCGVETRDATCWGCG